MWLPLGYLWLPHGYHLATSWLPLGYHLATRLRPRAWALPVKIYFIYVRRKVRICDPGSCGYSMRHFTNCCRIGVPLESNVGIIIIPTLWMKSLSSEPHNELKIHAIANRAQNYVTWPLTFNCHLICTAQIFLFLCNKYFDLSCQLFTSGDFLWNFGSL